MDNFAGGVLLGLAIGVLVTAFCYERMFRLAARFNKTGQPDVAPKKQSAATSGTPVNPEATAYREFSREAIQRGADELQELAVQSGYPPLSRKEAEEQAAQMLRNAGGFLGGAR